VRICNDAALRSRLIEAGKRRAIDFSDADRMAHEYWEVFDGALGATQSSALR
jgi:hypothetical protein